MVCAKDGDTVLVHFTGMLKDGTVFDSSLNRAPLTVCIGSGQVIPGFDRALIGMSPGESKVEVIPCSQAYGPHQPEMVLTVNRHTVFADSPVEVGQQLERTNSTGDVMKLTVIGIKDSRITLDANHSLAGKDLMFEIQLVELISSPSLQRDN